MLYRLRQIFRSRDISKVVVIKIYKTMVKPAAVYGSGTWAMTAMGMNRLGTEDRKILRRIYGKVVEQGTWRIGNNQELRELYKDLDIVADIKKKIMEWIGHVVRMDQGRTVKKVYENKPEQSRREDQD